MNMLFNIDWKEKVNDSVHSASDSGELKLTSVAKDWLPEIGHLRVSCLCVICALFSFSSAVRVIVVFRPIELWTYQETKCFQFSVLLNDLLWNTSDPA